MGSILNDGTVVQMMADLKQQDKTLWQKICDWFKNLAADLQAVVDAHKGQRPDSTEGRMVADMQDVIVILESLYGDALLDASENYKAAKKFSESVETSTKIAYSRRSANVFFEENVFPPFNRSRSEAHELAERWSRSENTESGQRKLISFHNKWYLIEAFEDMKYGYQIMRKLTKQEYIKETSYYGTITGYQSLQNTSSKNAALLRKAHNDTGRRHSVDIDASEHRGANYSLHGMGANKNRRGHIASDNSGDLPGSSVDQQGQNGSAVANSNSFGEDREKLLRQSGADNNLNLKEKFSLRGSEGIDSFDAAEIKNIQSIGRKSIHAFSATDVKATEKLAGRYWKEMGTKSPFFRAWFGDWRVNDHTEVEIADQKGDARGVQKNADTGWDIQVSGKVFNETKSHNMSFNKAAMYQ